MGHPSLPPSFSLLHDDFKAFHLQISASCLFLHELGVSEFVVSSSPFITVLIQKQKMRGSLYGESWEGGSTSGRPRSSMRILLKLVPSLTELPPSPFPPAYERGGGSSYFLQLFT